jgi:ribonuclease HI
MNLIFYYFNKSKMIEIYTDGACSGNPGPGGWGVYIIDGKIEIELGGSSEGITTNNKMELTAAIKALEYFETKKNIKLHTDSTYVLKGITEWIYGWKTKDWKKVKNVELWKKLDKLNSFHNVDWNYVPAHVGVFGNEKADSIAVSYIQR